MQAEGLNMDLKSSTQKAKQEACMGYVTRAWNK